MEKLMEQRKFFFAWRHWGKAVNVMHFKCEIDDNIPRPLINRVYRYDTSCLCSEPV